MEPGVKLVFIRPGEAIPGNADVIIIPGSKSTIGDLAFLRAQGWDIDIKAHVRRGGHVLGLCGGYQMLGKTIADPDGVDGSPGLVDGLGLLDIATLMSADKSTTLIAGTHCATGAAIEGYEIHLGRSEGDDCARPLLMMDDLMVLRQSMDGCRALMSMACSPAMRSARHGWPISASRRRWPMTRRSKLRSMRSLTIAKSISISID
jgi:adenosylcobyric acid synthase